MAWLYGLWFLLCYCIIHCVLVEFIWFVELETQFMRRYEAFDKKNLRHSDNGRLGVGSGLTFGGIRDPQKQWLSRRSLKCYFRPQITTRQHDSKRSPDGRLLHCFFVFFEHAVAVLAKAVGRDFAGTVVRTGKSGRNIYAERWLLVAGFHWPVVCGRTHCGGRLFPPRCFFLCLNRISSGIETRPTLYKLGLTSDFLQQWCPICRLSFVRSALSVSLTSPEFQQFNNNVQFEFRPAITCKFA